MDDTYRLSVPNSNPNSAFSHYEIMSEDPDGPELHPENRPDASYDDGNSRPTEYALIGVYSESSGKTGARTIKSGYRNLETLKTLLVDINGPIPEEAENDG
jgi:hypothetical protein